jgi:hypothetical protein
MRPPEIRYPLLWIAGGLAVALAAWLARPALDAVGGALRERWRRVAEGPPVPSSGSPMAIAGPMVRRVLLMREGVEATGRPGGRAVLTIGRRAFADVYDVWPLDGPPTHYRIGNRRPFGWVPSADVLPWDTRLVLWVEGSSAASPIVGWDAGRVRVALWDPERPWGRVAEQRWAEAGPGASRGVLLSRDELLMLLRHLIAGAPAGPLRARAIVGDLSGARAWGDEDLAAVRGALPAWAFAGEAPAREAAIEALSRINESWSPEASWSGLEFRSVPLEALP